MYRKRRNDIEELDEFVNARLHRPEAEMAVTIALLAHEPAQWGRYWAKVMRRHGDDPALATPGRVVVAKAELMLRAWSSSPAKRMTESECRRGLRRSFPALEAALAGVVPTEEPVLTTSGWSTTVVSELLLSALVLDVP